MIIDELRELNLEDASLVPGKNGGNGTKQGAVWSPDIDAKRRHAGMT
jgi:hypothetical protein